MRHLAWQAAEIGPLFVISSSMFESALHLLIAPLTGTTNHCKLVVERFIRGKVVSEIDYSEDDLAQFLRFSDNPSDVNEEFGLVESEELREFRFNNQSARVFCRFRKNFYFGSLAYGRESGADIFAFVDASTMATGEILFFYELDGKFCVLREKRIVSTFKLVQQPEGPVPNFAYVVEDKNSTIHVAVDALEIIFFPVKIEDNLYLVPLLSNFEHD